MKSHSCTKLSLTMPADMTIDQMANTLALLGWEYLGGDTWRNTLTLEYVSYWTMGALRLSGGHVEGRYWVEPLVSGFDFPVYPMQGVGRQTLEVFCDWAVNRSAA